MYSMKINGWKMKIPSDMVGTFVHFAGGGPFFDL